MTRAQKIAQLNDEFRKDFRKGKVLLSEAVRVCPYKSEVIRAVQNYEFQGVTDDNPYGENDLATVFVRNEQYCFRIDCLDALYDQPSRDPTDPKATRRVIHVMRSDENLEKVRASERNPNR